MNNKVEHHNDDFISELEYYTRLLYISFKTRISILCIGMGTLAVFGRVYGLHIPRMVIPLFVVWFLTNLIYVGLFKNLQGKGRKYVEWLNLSYYLFVITFITMLVHYLGGSGWIAFLFYLVDLIYANILMNRLKGMIVCFAMVMAYGALTTLEYFGIIPRETSFLLAKAPYETFTAFFVTHVVGVGVWFFLVSISCGLAATIQEERRRGLQESKNRLQIKADQLEKITVALRKQAAENKYMKSATMGYIEKKEFETNLVKKDLEEQIGNLRKTQKAMYFMIEDLNEMSSQLKDARDNLEQKVRERTDDLVNISRKLHRSERLAFLGKLAGSVTHEVRNPLAVLKNAAYYLENKMHDLGDEKVCSYIEIIKKEIMIIDSIIDDIMGFARTKLPDLAKTSIKEILEIAIDNINFPDMVVVKQEIEDVPEIWLDKDQVMHAIMNIANNAIMAMKGNGSLIFRVFEKDDEVYAEIEDTGPGIPTDERDLIFEPLYSSKPKGTGLGLPIAKMMIENQRGRIEFSTELGNGTLFSMIFPKTRKDRD